MNPYHAAPRKKSGSSIVLTAVLIALCFSFGVQNASGQAYLTAIGVPPFTTAAPVENGFSNLGNGNLHIEIPLVSEPQRGSLGFSAKLVYDSRIWKVVTGGSKTWQPTNVPGSQGGWRLVVTGQVGTYGESAHSFNCDTIPITTYTKYTNWFWTSPEGVTRTFSIMTERDPNHCDVDIPSGNSFATDSSGFHMYVTNYTAVSAVYAKDGTLVYPTLKDRNGNYFSADGSGNIIDTLSRKPVVKTVNGSTTYYDILNSQGSTSRFTVTTTTVNVNTNFGQTGVTEYSGNFTAIQSIALPDGSSYSFTYDSGTTAGNFGLLKTMTVPAQGQITYGFTTFQDSTGNRNRWFNTRTAQTGTWSGTSTYAPAVITTCTVGQSTCKQKITVTQPSGDYVVHTFNLDSGWIGAWDVQQQNYDLHNNLMMTTSVTFDMTHSGLYVVPQTAQVTVPVPGSASISRQTKYVYSNTPFTNANVTAVKEWLWYAGSSPTYPTTPDRETDFQYVTNYGNIVNLPSSATVNGTAGMVAQTTFSYDDPTHLSAKSGVTQHDDTNFGIGYTTRGNPTLIQQWVSGTNYVNSNINYDTTGQVTQTTDPANNSTGYVYGDDKFFSDNGANPPTTYTPSVVTNAYVTQVNLPITGSKTFGYYFNSGKKTFLKDQNGADTYAHFVDSLDRNTHVYGPSINGNRDLLP